MADSISNNGITVNLNIATPDNDGFIYISVVSTSVGTLSKRKSKIFELKIGSTSVAKVTAKSTSDANMKKAAKDFKSLLDKFAAKNKPVKYARTKQIGNLSISLVAGDSSAVMQGYIVLQLPRYSISYAGTNIDEKNYPRQSKWYGETIKLNSKTPNSFVSGSVTNNTAEVNTFWHWNTNDTGTGVAYSPGALYSANASVTLHAQWYKASDTYKPPSTSAYDYGNTKYGVSISAVLVNQTNIREVLGSLKNIVADSVTITENYNSDSRVQAKLSTITKADQSDGYIPYSRIRIIMSVPAKQWSEPIMTGYVSDIEEHMENGYVQRTYSIEGTLWGLLDHKLYNSIVISKGAKLLTVWTSLIKKCTKMQCDITGAKNCTFGNTVVYEPGTELSTILFEVSSGYNRMDVDPFGAITLRPYVSPSKKPVSRTINYKDLKGFAIAPLTRTTTEFDAPGRAIVTAMVSTKDSSGKTSQKTIVGHYDAPANDITSQQKRGWLSARMDSYIGTSEKPTKDELNKVAKKNWESSKQEVGHEWSGSCVFQNYHAGDVVYLIAPSSKTSNPTRHKVLLTAVSTSFRDFKQSLTMKEV